MNLSFAGSAHSIFVWAVALLSIALVLIRPRGWPEAWWAAGGACVLVIGRLITPSSAFSAIRKGLDVYLFLIGMMIMSELARREGVFDWIARHAVEASRGSRTRLFLLIYGVGILVTIFLSNDATAVVLTPAVLAAVRAAEATPLPYLLICAFIANAASFVLPISNPANLVVYRMGMPPLSQWLATFSLPSVASIIVTFAVLFFLSKGHLRGPMKIKVDGAPLSQTGKLTLIGIAVLAAILMIASALNMDLGAPAFAVGLLVATFVATRDRSAWKDLALQISWSVLPLVAGLFVIVEALNSAGAMTIGTRALDILKGWPPLAGAMSAAFGTALLSNLMNNLPSGLISGAVVQGSNAPHLLRNAVLIGIDLGPNLSITGSLATILWLIAVRREGLAVSFWQFLKWGALAMPLALMLATVAAWLTT